MIIISLNYISLFHYIETTIKITRKVGMYIVFNYKFRTFFCFYNYYFYEIKVINYKYTFIT